MTHDISNTRLFVTCTLIVLLDAILVFAFVRGCICDCCPSRFAVWIRSDRQLCRQCKNFYDRRMRATRYFQDQPALSERFLEFLKRRERQA